MTDYITMSAFTIKTTAQEEEWFLKLTNVLARGVDWDWKDEEDVSTFKKMMDWEGDLPEQWGWDVNLLGSVGTHFSTDDGGDIELMGKVLVKYLSKFCPKQYVTFEWVHVCSKMHSDAFSGEGMFVTAKGYVIHGVNDWLCDQIEMDKIKETSTIEVKWTPTAQAEMNEYIEAARATSLDEMVHESKAVEAAAFNNSSENEQLAYLLTTAFPITQEEAETFVGEISDN